MTADASSRERRSHLRNTLRILVSRVAALCLFAVGVLYWSRLIGAGADPQWRFDMMPLWWRIAAPVLAVLYPVAGAGVWMLTSWGTVIWVLVFMIEAVMRLGFSELFGAQPLAVGLHAGALLVLAILRGLGYVEQRRR